MTTEERKLEEAALTALVKATIDHRQAMDRCFSSRIDYLDGLKTLRPDEQAELAALVTHRRLSFARQMLQATPKAANED